MKIRQLQKKGGINDSGRIDLGNAFFNAVPDFFASISLFKISRTNRLGIGPGFDQ